MSKIVKGILIDPFTCTVTEVEHDANSIEGIYKLISHETMKVTCFTCVYSDAFEPGDAVFVDNEGSFKMPDRYFLFPGNPQPLAGKGLVLGSNDKGETVDYKTPLYFVQQTVVFLRAYNWHEDEFTLGQTIKSWHHLSLSETARECGKRVFCRL